MYGTSDFKQTSDINRRRLWKFIYSTGSNEKKKFSQFIFWISVKRCECESKKERGIKIFFLFTFKEKNFSSWLWKERFLFLNFLLSFDKSFKDFLWKLFQTSCNLVTPNSESHSIDKYSIYIYYISGFFRRISILHKNIKTRLLYT